MPYRSYVLARFVVRVGLFAYFKPEWSGLIVAFVALAVFYVVCKLASSINMNGAVAGRDLLVEP